MDIQTLMDSSSRRGCSSRRQQRRFFIILVFTVVVFVGYNTKMLEIPNFFKWTRDHSAKQTSRYLESGKKVTLTTKNLSSTRIDSNTAHATSSTRFLESGKKEADPEKNLSTIGIKSTKRSSTTTRINSTTAHATSPTQKDSTPPVRLPPYGALAPYIVAYPYPYHFIINEPRTCHVENPFLVLVVPVAPKNRADRDVIRRSWGGESLVLGKVVKLFFLLGLHSGEDRLQIQEQLQQESLEHRDLIQSNFVDCYKNLTIKTMVMLEWLDAYCSNAAYATKVDTDMFLNLPNLVKLLENAPKMNYMTGRTARSGVVIRKKKSKWYVPEEVYPRRVYPPFAHGPAYVLSLDLPKKLLGAATHIKALYLEDVFLGMCMKHLGLQLTDPPYWYSFSFRPQDYSRCLFSKIIATPTYKSEDRVRMWDDLKGASAPCKNPRNF